MRTITNRNRKSISAYLTEIKKIPVLSAEEEFDLVMKYKNGNQTALDKLIRANLRFVVREAKKKSGYLELGDLIAAGNTALIKAARRFDATKGFKLISYAVRGIRNSMSEAIRDAAMLRGSLDNNLAPYRIINATQEFEEEYGYTPTTYDLAIFMNVEEETLRATMNASKVKSLYSTVYSDSDTLLLDEIQDSSSEMEQERSFKKQMVQNAFVCLSPNELEIIQKGFGFGNNPRKVSMDLIATSLGISIYEAKKLKASALRKLKEQLSVSIAA